MVLDMRSFQCACGAVHELASMRDAAEGAHTLWQGLTTRTFYDADLGYDPIIVPVCSACGNDVLLPTKQETFYITGGVGDVTLHVVKSSEDEFPTAHPVRVSVVGDDTQNASVINGSYLVSGTSQNNAILIKASQDDRGCDQRPGHRHHQPGALP